MSRLCLPLGVYASLAVWLVGGCGASPELQSQPDVMGVADVITVDAQLDAEPSRGEVETSVAAAPPALVVGSWNLKNFSRFGVDEFRLGDIAEQIALMNPDILAIQEVKAAEAPWRLEGEAWDALLSRLEGYEGVRAQWRSEDTVVGLIYRSESIELVGAKELFPTDSWSFPRAPLQVTVNANVEDRSATFDVIVLHLKAYSDAESRNRRLQAVQKLHALISEREDASVVIIGDYNDSPHDPPETNIFQSTFVDNPSEYLFLTHLLPYDTATTVGWPGPGSTDDEPGEFLDHAVLTDTLADLYPNAFAEVLNREPTYFTWWEQTYSDHFPVLVHLEP